VVPATARPLRWLDGYAFAAGLSYAVFANGAVVYDVGAREVIARHLMPPATLAGLCGRISDTLPQARFAVETDDGWAMWHEPGYPLRSDLGQPGVAPATRAALVARPAAKLLVKAPGVDPDLLVARVVAAAGADAEVSVSASYGLAELAAVGVSKASGLAAVAARLGVPAGEVVAFGDMPNDLPMLAWAGRAVAVANAHPDVRAAAHVIADSNDDDGVARWLAAMLSLD
jgi:hydroxymethylpyrimidine pyrophosphatase-like HAD family hydrolase